MGWLQITRLASLCVLSVFSLIPLGINAHFLALAQSTGDQSAAPAFMGLSVAVGVLTIVTTPTMIIVDIFRRGAWTSKIFVELLWLDILWLLWLVAAALTASFFSKIQEVCSEFSNTKNNQESVSDAVESVCALAQTTEAFSWLCFIILTVYTTVLCVGVRMARASFTRPGSVWTKSVRELGEPASNIDTKTPLAQKGQDFA